MLKQIQVLNVSLVFRAQCQWRAIKQRQTLSLSAGCMKSSRQAISFWLRAANKNTPPGKGQ
jgi:hypothetical protein